MKSDSLTEKIFSFRAAMFVKCLLKEHQIETDKKTWRISEEL
jgi:hypothetical protein